MQLYRQYHSVTFLSHIIQCTRYCNWSRLSAWQNLCGNVEVVGNFSPLGASKARGRFKRRRSTSENTVVENFLEKKQHGWGFPDHVARRAFPNVLWSKVERCLLVDRHCEGRERRYDWTEAPDESPIEIGEPQKALQFFKTGRLGPPSHSLHLSWLAFKQHSQGG